MAERLTTERQYVMMRVGFQQKGQYMKPKTQAKMSAFGRSLPLVGEAVLVSTALCLMEVEGGGTLVVLLLILAFTL